jgi:hypothetical protein
LRDVFRVGDCGTVALCGCTYAAIIIAIIQYTDEKEKKIFLIYKEIQKGAVAKSKAS